MHRPVPPQVLVRRPPGVQTGNGMIFILPLSVGTSFSKVWVRQSGQK